MNETINLMKTLSDEVRIRIINILYYSDLYVCEIADVLKLPQSTVSRHLNILRNSGLIMYEKEGLWTKYSITKKHINILETIIKDNLKNDSKILNDKLMLENRLKSNRGCDSKC